MRFRLRLDTTLVLLCLLIATAGIHARSAQPDHVALADLPVQAKVTLDLIVSGGPFPYDRDGIVFGNRERNLPARSHGYYREYTVPTPGTRGRGARRIVCGGDQASVRDCYYSDDHYRTFRLIR
jgi:ribonuclease T1